MEYILNNKLATFKKLILYILFHILIYYLLNIYIKDKYDKSNYNNFFQILPKINLNDNKTINLKDIFKSRILYINDAEINKEYIEFIQPININIENKYKIKYNNISIKLDYFKNKKSQLNYSQFGKLCIEEKLINPGIIKKSNKPLISVILPSYNKEQILLKSIRSIQNQSLKNIEIIIVDDCSTDNTSKIYNYLLATDPRIRVFYHLKNMGVWRSRIDGFLYSRGQYIIHFDPGDLYEDNYVLEDSYEVIKKYNLDSVKMVCRQFFNYYNFNYTKIPINIKFNYTKIAYKPNIDKYNSFYFKYYGYIWTRLIRKNVVIKALLLLNSILLNAYKNLWEDIWWNKLINKVSDSILILKRYMYLYYKDGKGEGDIKLHNDIEKNKIIHEFIYFLYFDLYFLPKKNNKKIIINQLYKYNNKKSKINLTFLKKNYNILDELLILLINDPSILNRDKIFAYELLIKSKIKQKKQLIMSKL